MRNKIVVIGCGRFGARIANESSADGDNVVIVDSDSSSFDRLNDDYSGYTVTCDATDISSLEEEGYIKDAYRLVIATGNDNVNLFLSHVAASIYGVPEIFVRFNDPNFASLVKGMNIKAIYPFELSLKKYQALSSGRKDS
mgnify:CR=1 FL=1